MRLREYQDICQNIRLYTNLRFAQLTLYIAFNAGLFTALNFEAVRNHDYLLLLISLLGIVSTYVFWRMEVSSTQKWQHFKDLAKAHERALGFGQYSEWKNTEGTSATQATRILFYAFFATWLVIIISCLRLICDK